MARRQIGWLDLVRELGDALLGVVRAELAVIWEHWRLWGRNWAIAAALFVVALFLTFWLSGLVVVALVHGLMAAFDLALWKAALLIALALLLAMAALAGGGWLVASRSDNPMTAARRQLDEHRTWLDGKILGERESKPAEKRLAQGDDDGTEQADTAGDGAAGGPPAAG